MINAASTATEPIKCSEPEIDYVIPDHLHKHFNTLIEIDRKERGGWSFMNGTRRLQPKLHVISVPAGPFSTHVGLAAPD